jgi:DJ-1 family protein
MPTALIVLAPGAEEIEFITVPDLLVRAGTHVTVATLATAPVVTGSRGLPLAAHGTWDLVLHRTFDLIYLPGGMGSAHACRDDARVQDVAQAQLAAGRLVACICAAPLALVPRRLAHGRRLTSFPGVRAEVEPHAAAWLDQPVVVDGPLVTSQAAGTTMALGLTLIRLLHGDDAAVAVATAIKAPLP